MLIPPAIPTPRDLRRRRFHAHWMALIDRIIDTRPASARADAPRDLFDLLRDARDPETGAAFTRPQLRDQVATMIVAGHETTAITLFWSLYLLALPPPSRTASPPRSRASISAPKAPPTPLAGWCKPAPWSARRCASTRPPSPWSAPRSGRTGPATWRSPRERC